MTNLNEALNQIAVDLKKNQPESTFHWDIRGEIPNEEIDENKNLIAILHLKTQDEIIPNNKTMRIFADLSGQILIREYSNETIKKEVAQIEEYIQGFISSLYFYEVQDALILEANSSMIETATDEIYLTFNLPLEFVIQF